MTIRPALLLAAAVLLAACLATVHASPAHKKPKHYDTSGGPVNDKLNVHVVMHTHDDVGWLKTVDQYYMGANNSIQNAGVQYILDSVMLALAQNPDRKFIYVEIAFFKRWWDEQSEDVQDQVKQFVKNGQLEFINGGYCMSDEAAPSYVDMIDQQTLGHQFLLHTFGVTPVTGWQIDPFGHSNMMATIYALMGMNSWFFARADYQDAINRNKQLTNEVIMRPSKSLGANVDIFTGYMHGYGAPDGFDWNTGSWDAPIQDDPDLHDVNVQDRVNQFVQECLDQAKLYRTNNIMLSMGSDFEYSNANTWYKNMDKLLHYLKLDGRINAFYSTPTIYTNAKHAAGVTWTTKDDDWFPYADFIHAFWTGYFTSRPAFKAYVRTRSNILQGCRHLELQAPALTVSSFQLWEAMSVAQHHDGVSGTEKQHVTYDYTQRLAAGTEECNELFNSAYHTLYGPLGPALTFVDCPYLNESVCDPTMQAGKFPLAVALYNTLAQSRSEYIRLPITPNTKLVIKDGNGNLVDSQIFTSDDGSQDIFFQADIPAVGYSTYILAPASEAEPVRQEQRPVKDSTMENKFYKLTFQNGLLSEVYNKISDVTVQVSQSLYWYNSSDGNVPDSDNRGQASGAYIFRPNCTEDVSTPCKPFAINDSPNISIIATDMLQVAVQVFSPWAMQRIILYEDSDAIDIEYTVGPIPIDDDYGKEIVSVFTTDIDTQGVFYTDANGRDIQKRVFNFRPTWELNVTDPVSGNFYPVDHYIFMNESSGAQRQFTVLTDRSHGGASLSGGELEIMIHRRTLYDDSRGVGEPMNESGVDGRGLVVTGTHRIIFDTTAKSPQKHKSHMQRLTFAPILHFAEVPTSLPIFVKSFTLNHTALAKELPPNVHLLHAHDNFVFAQSNEMILRLAHLYEVDEDPVMSVPVQINLLDLFSGISLQSCNEMSLSANQPASQVKRFTWQTTEEDTREPRPHEPYNVKDFTVTLNPMEIRTFNCVYNSAATKARKD